MSADHPIRAYRERQSPPLSQGEFGERVGVTRFTVMRWEGGAPIDEKLLPAVSKETGIPARELRPDIAARHEEIFGELARPTQ
jgi:transcriptional regulator with XRE-family HTH domain